MPWIWTGYGDPLPRHPINRKGRLQNQWGRKKFRREKILRKDFGKKKKKKKNKN